MKKSITDSKADQHDVKLLEKIAHQKSRALEELYERHGLTLLSYLVQFLEDRQLAEEVLQDVMMAVWKSAASFHGNSQVRTWLFAIARNMALRAKKRHLKFDHAVYEETLEIGHVETPHDVFVKEELYQALDQLSDEHREVLNLVFFYDFSGLETADLLGIPLGTLKSRLYRAKQALREILEKERRNDA